MSYKYIMLNVSFGSIEKKIPIIFPDILVHDDIFKVVKAIPMMETAEVVGAGDIDIFARTISSKSVTLKIGPRDEDIVTINVYEYLHGVLSHSKVVKKERHTNP